MVYCGVPTDAQSRLSFGLLACKVPTFFHRALAANLNLFSRLHNMQRLPLFSLAFMFLACCQLAHAARLALVIGNDEYRHVTPLRKAGNDADAMAAFLTSAGFEVVNRERVRNLDRTQMNSAFSRFAARVKSGDEVVVFYAGHGLQEGNTSYLTGVDFPKNFDPVFVRSEASQLSNWQREINRRGARFVLFVIDACREDLSSDGLVRSLEGSGTSTIIPSTPPEGQMVLYSARSGQLALDRLSDSEREPNSVFTRVFLQEAKKRNQSILDIVAETEERVGKLAASVIDRRSGKPHAQKPALSNEAGIRVRFCFVGDGGCGAALGPLATPGLHAEKEAWDAAKASNTRGAYEAYLRAYPGGAYANAARVAIAGFVPATNPEPRPPAPEPLPPQASTLRPNVPHRDRMKNGGLAPEVMLIPAGSNVMGSNESDDEKPPHEVTISRAFALGRTEVTVGQYLACVAARGCDEPEWRKAGSQYNHQTGSSNLYSLLGAALAEDNRPIVGVSWDNAKQYVEWLSGQTGEKYRLPSEAEWEYACRGGQRDQIYCGGDNVNAAGWSQINSGSRPNVVGQRPIGGNGYGLYDMSGNVWEWVEDCWVWSYASNQPANEVARTSGCTDANRRVLRGASWGSVPQYLRAANRLGNATDKHDSNVGFRVARTVNF